MLANDGISASPNVSELVDEARSFAERERRLATRYPFFRTAVVSFDGGKYQAYTRDIGDPSIGLMHGVELPLRDVEVTVLIDDQKCLKLLARVERCEMTIQGWYVSGLSFI